MRRIISDGARFRFTPEYLAQMGGPITAQGPDTMTDSLLKFSDDSRYPFDSARDAIDAVSRFEAGTLAEWEYRIEACEFAAGLRYRVSLNSVSPGDLRRGFLSLA